jgi:hypothetical protein
MRECSRVPLEWSEGDVSASSRSSALLAELIAEGAGTVLSDSAKPEDVSAGHL